MRWYADVPARRSRQLLGDGLALAALVLGTWLSLTLHDKVLALGAAGRRLSEAGTSLSDGAGSATSGVGDLPLVGRALTAPFGRLADAGGSVTAAGDTTVRAVDALATTVALVGVLMTLALVALAWGRPRMRWVRAAGATRAMAAGGPDLLALRALAGSSPASLAALARRTGTPDLAAAWRRGDPSTVAALADLHTSGLGLRRAASR